VGGIATLLTATVDTKHIDSFIMPFGPTVDGYVLEDMPIATIQAGEHNHVPLVIGTNAQEAGIYIPAIAMGSCIEYELVVRHMLPTFADQALAAYPCNDADSKSPYQMFLALTSDATLTCPARRSARAIAASQTEPVFRYWFSHSYSYGSLAAQQAFHTAEIPYIFGTFATLPYDPTPDEKTLSRQMQTYWRNLAASGDPNGGAQPTWVSYDATSDNALRLDTPIAPVSAFESAGCAFWDSVE
jgi:para-nitrobenzyl esterase